MFVDSRGRTLFRSVMTRLVRELPGCQLLSTSRSFYWFCFVSFFSSSAFHPAIRKVAIQWRYVYLFWERTLKEEELTNRKEEEGKNPKDYYLTVVLLMVGWMLGTARKRAKVWEAKKPVTWCWFSVPVPLLLAFETRRRWASASSESRSAISSAVTTEKERKKKEEEKRKREGVNKSEHGKSTSAYINLYPIKDHHQTAA